MKPRRASQRTNALTLVELLVIITALVLIAVVLLPANRPTKPIDCKNNLHQISLGFRVWAGDNNDKYPMEIAVTNGGAMEPARIGDAVSIFRVMSNELSTPKVLLCPADTGRFYATNFTSSFTASSISYFVGLDAGATRPRRFLSGDDNFSLGGSAVKPGLLELSTNALIVWNPGHHVSPESHFWTAARNRFIGNLLLVDGSVQPTTSSDLCRLLRQTGLATNRLAIP